LSLWGPVDLDVRFGSKADIDKLPAAPRSTFAGQRGLCAGRTFMPAPPAFQVGFRGVLRTAWLRPRPRVYAIEFEGVLPQRPGLGVRRSARLHNVPPGILPRAAQQRSADEQA